MTTITMNFSHAYRRFALRGRRNWREAFRSTSGSVDLASVMVGILILGIVAGIISATVFGVIPWTQENTARISLEGVREAQSVSRVQYGQFDTTDGLVDHGLLEHRVTAWRTDGQINAGRGSSVAPHTIDDPNELPPDNIPLVTVSPDGSCYVAATRAATGRILYLTSKKPAIVTSELGGGKPDTSDCADFPPVAYFSTPPPPTPPPVPQLTLDYPDTSFDLTKTNEKLTAVLGPTGSTAVFTSDTALPSQLSLDPATGTITGPSSWPLGVTSVTGGYRASCATMSDTTARCWGYNYLGQLGDGTTTDRYKPAAVLTAASTPMTGAKKIVMSSASVLANFTCALMQDGTVDCWGYNNANRSLGDNTNVNRNYAAPVKNGSGPLTGVKDVGLGLGHACALLQDKTVTCWGRNTEKQLGNTGAVAQGVPAPVAGLSNVTSISAGGNTTCAIAAQNLYCWGEGANYVYADGGTGNSATPKQVNVGGPVKQVTIGQKNNCVILTDNTLRCWGKSSAGTLAGAGVPAASFLVPYTMPQMTNGTSQVVVGGDFICALDMNGAPTCWGTASEGELGDGTITAYSPSAHFPTGYSSGGITALAALGTGACALKSGAVKCWGDSTFGQAGDDTHGTSAFKTSPAQPEGLSGLTGWPILVTITADAGDGRTVSKPITLTAG